FAEQGTHIALAVGQTSDSRIRPTRMVLPNCFYFVRLFFRMGITALVCLITNLLILPTKQKYPTVSPFEAV
ncbi:MAG: hypothetical protein KBG52_07645, partial [Neisseria sp.]|nr:hypothetical protein [Neisseria sp.]